MPNYNVNNNYYASAFTEYSDSDYSVTDSEDIEDIQDIIYEPDEAGSTRFTIALCELFNEKIHGYTLSDVKYHYLVNTRFKKLDMKCINEHTNFINNSYIYDTNLQHNIFKNYSNMILKGKHIKPQIVEVLYLKDDRGFDYCVAIIKTFWIKIIQRAWKNICVKREEINCKRASISALHYREIHGKWPDNCIQYPGLRSMLSNLHTCLSPRTVP
jgi:hypothetical protein